MFKGRRNVLIVFVLAAAAFILATATISAARRMAPVVMARQALPAGARLTDQAVEVREIPAAAIMAGAFESIAQVEGQVLSIPRAAGDQITADMVGESATTSVIDGLPPDHRAVAVHVNQATGLVGSIQVGSRVGVVGMIDPAMLDLRTSSVTVEEREAPPPTGPVAMIVLSNLRVLLVPQMFRYQETLPNEEDGMFATAYTSADQQEASVVLLAVPVEPIPLRPGGPMVSPVDLLPLMDHFGHIHLVGEPQNADYSQPPTGISLYQVYDTMAMTMPLTSTLTLPVIELPGPTESEAEIPPPAATDATATEEVIEEESPPPPTEEAITPPGTEAAP